MKPQRDKLAVVHFWAVKGGFGKRYQMFLDECGDAFEVVIVPNPWKLFPLLFKKWLPGTRIVFFTSLMAPAACLARLVRPSCRLRYFIRGDEYGWAISERRYLRGGMAVILQKWLSLLRCRFIFVSGDLLCRFEQRLGLISERALLPNTVGRPLPPGRPVSRRIGLVGNFQSVKNIEWALASLSRGMFEVALFGNTRFPPQWQRPWLKVHGISSHLVSDLATHCDLVVICSFSEGFPNVLIDAIEAGCSVVLPFGYPFATLPINPNWRFEMDSVQCALARMVTGEESPLEHLLETRLKDKRDFRADNGDLFNLLESNWGYRVREVVI